MINTVDYKNLFLVNSDFNIEIIKLGDFYFLLMFYNFILIRLDQIFYDVFNENYQFMSIDSYNHTYLATALLVRGDVTATEIRQNINR